MNLKNVSIRQTCDVSIIPAKEQVIRVNHFSTYFYTFGGKLFWKCSTTNQSGLPVEKHASVTLAPGLWHIQAPKQSDCTITTTTFTYRSFSPLEVVSQFETLSIDTDFRSLLNLSAGEIDLGIKLIEEHGNQNAIKLHEIKAAIDKAKAETWQYSSFQGTGIGLGFTALLAIATLAVLCIAYFCLRKKAKTTIHQILNVPLPSAPPTQGRNAQPIQVMITLDGKSVPTIIYVTPVPMQSLLGVPAIKELNILVGANSYAHLEQIDNGKAICSTKAISIPPFSGRFIKVQTIPDPNVASSHSSPSQNEVAKIGVVMNRLTSNNGAPKIVAGLYNWKKNRSKVAILNHTGAKQQIPKDQFLGVVQECSDQDIIRPWKPKSYEDINKDVFTDWNDKKRFKAVLSFYIEFLT